MSYNETTSSKVRCTVRSGVPGLAPPFDVTTMPHCFSQVVVPKPPNGILLYCLALGP